MCVLPITVVALATTPWIVRHLNVTESFDRIVLPGLCQGDWTVSPPCRSSVGPKDLRGLPDYFDAKSGPPADYGKFDITILAEINHAPQLTLDDILTKARKASTDGADIIDLGCNPVATWETHRCHSVRRSATPACASPSIR